MTQSFSMLLKLTLLLCSSFPTSLSHVPSGFQVAFQSSGGVGAISTDEWAEFQGKIPRFLSFTACHWEFLNFFNTNENNIWSYCVKASHNDTAVECVQYWYKADPATGYRHITAFGRIKDFRNQVNVEPFPHRSWNHFCWSYNSGTGENRMYLNGRIMGNFTVGGGKGGPGIDGMEEVADAAFIMGQEPDALRGGFDEEQAFIGNLTELNIWSRVKSEEEIKLMSNCSLFPKGDIVNWDKNKFKINKAVVSDLEDLRLLCQHSSHMVMFPQKLSLKASKALCAAHSGRICTPHSQEENEKLLHLVNSHQSRCLDRTKGGMVWLHLKYRAEPNSWFHQDHPTNFTNWKAHLSQPYPNNQCAFLQSDGKWSFISGTSCPELELCTACCIPHTPVLLLKGLCQKTSWDSNYYLHKDEDGQVYYQGFTDSKIVKQGRRWRFVRTKEDDEGNDSVIELVNNGPEAFPVGRFIWDTKEPSCEINKSKEMVLTLSNCEFGKQFSCDSGYCIDIYKRCDNIKDCRDASDEAECEVIRIPFSYRKGEAAEPDEEAHEPLPIKTSVTVLNVDSIDTVMMRIGLTFEIQLKWRDGRLDFYNLFDDGMGNIKEVPEEAAEEIWLPMPYIIHETAVLGEMQAEPNMKVNILSMSEPNPMEMGTVREELLYKGSRNDLVVTQRFKMDFRCNFFLRYFPFDNQKCDFVMMMKVKNNMTMRMVKPDPEDGPAIVYNGPRLINEFEINEMSTLTNLTHHQTSFTFSICFDRNYINQLASTYFRTALLWCLAYFTLYINVQNFSDRFMGAVTALLVLAALLSSINDDLPKTSYFKYIDLWFMWYIINIFLITVYHILLDRYTRGTLGVTDLAGAVGKALATGSRRYIVNKVFQVFFLLITFIFNITYFILTTQKYSYLREYQK